MRRYLFGLLFAAANVAVAATGSAPDRAAGLAEVRATELAFAAALMENQPAAFAAFLDEEAVFVGGAEVTRGKAAILEAWKGFFGEARPHFEWHPEVVELSGDGTLGLTRGPWTLRAKDADGKEVERTGIFNSVWRRQADGTWKIVFDAGCSPCPKCGP